MLKTTSLIRVKGKGGRAPYVQPPQRVVENRPTIIGFNRAESIFSQIMMSLTYFLTILGTKIFEIFDVCENFVETDYFPLCVSL